MFGYMAYAFEARLQVGSCLSSWCLFPWIWWVGQRSRWSLSNQIPPDTGVNPGWHDQPDECDSDTGSFVDDPHFFYFTHRVRCFIFRVPRFCSIGVCVPVFCIDVQGSEGCLLKKFDQDLCFTSVQNNTTSMKNAGRTPLFMLSLRLFALNSWFSPVCWMS